MAPDAESERYADGVRPLGWWVISGESLLDMLRRCHEGEEPDAVYAEEYANTDVRNPTHDHPSTVVCPQCDDWTNPDA